MPACCWSSLHQSFLLGGFNNMLHRGAILHCLMHNSWRCILHIFYVLFFERRHCYELVIFSNTTYKVFLCNRSIGACLHVLYRRVLVHLKQLFFIYSIEFLQNHWLLLICFFRPTFYGILSHFWSISRNELIFDICICLHHSQWLVCHSLVSCIVKSTIPWLHRRSSLVISWNRKCSISLGKPHWFILHFRHLPTVPTRNSKRCLHHFLHSCTWRVMYWTWRVVILL